MDNNMEKKFQVTIPAEDAIDENYIEENNIEEENFDENILGDDAPAEEIFEGELPDENAFNNNVYEESIYEASEFEDYPSATPEKSKKSVAKKLWITFGITFGVIFLIAVIVWLVVDSYLSKINYLEQMGGDIVNFIDDFDPNAKNSPQDEIDSAIKDIRDNADSEYELMYDDDVLNVLFIGTDARFTGQSARSDAMILISINKRTEKIIATSFLRDTYVSIPEHNENRLNTAYAYGGTYTLFQTFEQNFKIRVDKYVLVDFESFVDVIDAIQGVEITVTKEEANKINSSMSALLKYTYNKSDEDIELLPGAGTYTLNGDQALAYARIRKLDSDRGRAQRQRNVLDAIYKRVQDMGYNELNNFANTVLPRVSTNMKKREIVLLMMRMLEIKDYDVEQHTMPESGTYKYLTIDQRDVTVIDFDKNIALLKKNIYGDDETEGE